MSAAPPTVLSTPDEKYRNELDKYLALLKHQGAADVWSDHCIRPGEAFDPAIAATLEASDLIPSAPAA